MTEKRFTVNYRENTRLYEVKDNLHIIDCGGFAIEYSAKKCCEELNALYDENEQLKKENNKLHQKIFEMRTNIALDRTEISRQSYTSKEFLDEIEKW